jgi:DNA repair protein RadB
MGESEALSMESRRRIPTGSSGLDALLGGGASTGEVTLLYGEPGSGKTAVALSAASQLLRLDPASRVVFIDSDGKFSPDRLTQMTSSKESLRRLRYVHPTTFERQAEALDALSVQLQPRDLAIVDSVTGLYRVETGDTLKTFTENKELNRQLGLVKEMAVTRNVALVVTGQVRSVLDSPVPAVEPVAPRLLRFWSDVVVKLENTGVQGVKQASVEKPMRRRGAVRFMITQAGLRD